MDVNEMKLYKISCELSHHCSNETLSSNILISFETVLAMSFCVNPVQRHL